MRPFPVPEAGRLKGILILSGDKSIAHRCLLISALSRGPTTIKNFPINQDCLFTLRALRKLGIKIKLQPQGKTASRIKVFGCGLSGLKKPRGPIFLGGSGTTFRLLLGVLAGYNFAVTLEAGGSLAQRPMLRVTGPLRMMGAKINSKLKIQNSKIEEYPPITIKGGNLKAIAYKMPVASAQVKSAILLAGLHAQGKTRIIEPVPTRDHTERMLRLFRAGIGLRKNRIILEGGRELSSPGIIYVPGDISSASFFIVAGIILPDSCLRVKNVGLNPSRTGIIRALKKMGADIQIQKSKVNPSTALRIDGERSRTIKTKNYEPIGDIIVKSSALQGIRIRRKEIPFLIDELPILMVAASLARGKTVFEGAGELRVKETDRIRSMSENLKKMGARIAVRKGAKFEDIIIEGVEKLKGAKVKSFGDHRTAMSMIVAGLRAKGSTYIDNVNCINKSFPDFLRILKDLIS
jgi:3-phosphoshikimate 1-carboxyvinyltransferase